MRISKQGSLICILLLMILMIGVSIIAGPTIIRDARIKDIALTPALGRGYTISTNTFQSQCMKDIVTTEPSYDFRYEFEAVEENSSSVVGKSSALLFKEFGIDTSDGDDDVVLMGKVKVFKQHILVTIDIDTYYASVDETKSKIGDSAANLLKSNDIPGFFNSCGSYYVKTLGRNAKFVSVFTYVDKTEEGDEQFEDQLKQQLQGFGKKAGGGGSGFAASASSKKLSISSRALGLGKSEKASLISYDIETFKTAIKDAFDSMQSEKTGKVTSMEVVPWIENTEFQELIKLDEEFVDPETKKAMPLYKKKYNLNLNAELLSEIDRADRNMVNIYYKAKMCKQTIDANWKTKGKFYPGLENAEVMNNRLPNLRIKLTVLDKELAASKIEAMRKAEEKFIMKTAQPCIDKMIEANMFEISWRKMPECKKVRGQLSAVLSETIDNYCMPTLVPPKKPKKAAPAGGGAAKPTP
ncbi:MAG: hypothetical protein GY754_01760 [bacterium]|nr:hypothetical protein [bacterium]